MSNELNFKLLRETLQQAREAARRDAKTCGRAERNQFGRITSPAMPFIRSRGTLLCTSDSNGQCNPNVAAECPVYTGTKREIVELVTLIETDARYFNVTEIYIEGGYDISETMSFDDYEPRVSEWNVLVWRRGDGYAVPVAEVN